MDTQLFHAIKNENTQVFKILVSQGANINSVNSSGNTLLHQAVLKSNKEIVKCLIDNGADINLLNYESETPMNIALNNYFPSGDISIQKMLIEAGANVNTKSKYSSITTLQYAALKGDVDFVRLLIGRGAELNPQFNGKWTLLHYAAFRVKSEDPSIFEFLLAQGLDVNAKISNDDQTPLHFLLKNPVPFSLCKIFDVFSKYGADFDALDNDNCTLMNYAVGYRNMQGVKALVICGEWDVNSYFDPIYKQTILQAACFNEDLPTVKFLLKNNADINKLDTHNVSPLQCVLFTVIYYHKKNYPTEQMKLLKYLLKWNPDINTITNEGENILTVYNPEDEEYFYTLPDYLWQILLEHLAKLRANNYPIHVKLLETISENSAYKIYYEKCNEEIELAKMSKLHSESWVTIFNILVDDKRNLIQYAGNEELIKNFPIENQLQSQFPIYGSLIQKRFSKAKINRSILDQAEKSLSNLLPDNLKRGCIMKILSFLSKRDLQKLCL